MPRKLVKIFAPATIANLGSGFDVLGIAINQPGDIVTASRTAKSGVSFTLKTKHRDVPADQKNVAAYVSQLMIDEFKPSFGIALTLNKRMPVGSGLGSSAASSVAAVAAINELLPRPLPKRDLLRFAVEGEHIGHEHIRSYDPLDVVSLPLRNEISWVVVCPQLVVRTHDAREALPKEVPLNSAIRQWGNLGGLVVGLARGDAELVGKCTEDVLIEPYRAKLVPGFQEVKQAALAAGAHGCTLSGSGPSMFAVASSTKSARKIALAMSKTFSTVAKVKSQIFISDINMRGAMTLS